MSTSPSHSIRSSREVNAPLETLYEAYANRHHLKEWWGPEGFTNTIHEFDLRPGGSWILTMHGPEKGNYENLSVFMSVVPNKLVSWTRRSQPLFDMTIEFDPIGPSRSQISFLMFFKTEEERNKMEKFVLPKNEENFDRLERHLVGMLK